MRSYKNRYRDFQAQVDQNYKPLGKWGKFKATFGVFSRARKNAINKAHEMRYTNLRILSVQRNNRASYRQSTTAETAVPSGTLPRNTILLIMLAENQYATTLDIGRGTG